MARGRAKEGGRNGVMSEGKRGRSKREERIGVERGEKGEKMRYIYIHTYILKDRHTYIRTDRQINRQTETM